MIMTIPQYWNVAVVRSGSGRSLRRSLNWATSNNGTSVTLPTTMGEFDSPPRKAAVRHRVLLLFRPSLQKQAWKRPLAGIPLSHVSIRHDRVLRSGGEVSGQNLYTQTQDVTERPPLLLIPLPRVAPTMDFFIRAQNKPELAELQRETLIFFFSLKCCFLNFLMWVRWAATGATALKSSTVAPQKKPAGDLMSSIKMFYIACASKWVSIASSFTYLQSISKQTWAFLFFFFF